MQVGYNYQGVDISISRIKHWKDNRVHNVREIRKLQRTLIKELIKELQDFREILK